MAGKGGQKVRAASPRSRERGTGGTGGGKGITQSIQCGRANRQHRQRGPSEVDAASCSDESEKILLGAYCDRYVKDPDLPTEWLYREAHLEIHRAILVIKSRGDEVNKTSLSNEIYERGTLGDVGGADYLHALEYAVESAGFTNLQVETALHDVKRHAERRFDWRWRERLVSASDLVDTLPVLNQEMQLERERLFGAVEQEPEILGVSLAEVGVEDVHWLWPGRVAFGKITMCDGDGGVGKSLMTLDLAARVRMARGMPDGSPGLDEGAGVVIVCGEDGLADTVKPRLLAAGVSPAALEHVRAINAVPVTLADGSESERMVALLADLPRIEATITAIGARLLIIDPITAYLGEGVDSYKDAEVRRVLTPLARMAERTGVAVVCIRHLNRSHGASAQHRGLGSVAFLNVARVGLLFSPNPDAEGEYLMSRYKGNIGKPPPTLGYRITQVGEAEHMPKIEWLGERETSAETALASQSGAREEQDRKSAMEHAMEFLRGELESGEARAEDVIEQSNLLRISPRTLDRARSELDVKARRVGFGKGGHWLWSLPAEEDDKERQEDEAGALSTEAENNGAGEPVLAKGRHIPMGNREFGALSENTGADVPIQAPSSKGRQDMTVGALRVESDSVPLPSADASTDVEWTCSHCGRHEHSIAEGGSHQCDPVLRSCRPRRADPPGVLGGRV